MYKVLFLAGPTASGKTEYAIRLANDFYGEIVSADSMQIYKYMDIGSAKPTKDEQQRAKHWLIDEIDPSKPFNVSDYKTLAQSYINDIHNRAKLPIVCGGTGLYINALLYDMDFDAPGGSAAYRENLLKRFEYDGDKLFEYLKSLDSAAAKDEDRNNIKRTVRYIERLENGEASISGFADIKSKPKDYQAVFMAISPGRELLYERINRRVDKLIEMGLIDEVNKLIKMGFTKDDIAMKGIGYKELMDGLPIDEAIELIKLNTRHYAKRQIIWLRRYKDELKWFNTETDSYDDIKNWVASELNK